MYYICAMKNKEGFTYRPSKAAREILEKLKEKTGASYKFSLDSSVMNYLKKKLKETI